MKFRFRQPELIPLLFITCAVLMFIGLGVWQLQRLHWKEAEISRIASAEALPTLGGLPDDSKDAAYRKAALTGTWQIVPVLHMVSRQSGGYVWLLPFKLEDSDQVVLASLGWFPTGAQVKPLPAGPVTVEGYLREPKPKRLFSPGNVPEKNIWFTEDIAAMSQATGFTLYPLILEREALPPLRNDHLGYAITWFLLAGVAVVMFVAWLRERA